MGVSSRLIFYIDDEESIGLIAQGYINKHLKGVMTKVFTSGHDALAEYKKVVPDVIITDYNRTKDSTSTLEFLELVRKDPRPQKSKIILVSSSDEAATVEHLVDVRLRKPIILNELAAVIKKFN